MAGDPAGADFAPSHLRRRLLDAGVGTRWSYRDLARASSDQLKKDWWGRAVAPIPAGEVGRNIKGAELRLAAKTLVRLGESVTFEQLDRAMLADRGHIPPASGDDLSEVLARVENLSLNDQLRLIQEVAQLLAPDGLADHSRTSASRSQRER